MNRTLLFIAILVLSLFAIDGKTYANSSAELDMSPAKWIWYPSGRVLQNTFVLFRKEFNLGKQPEKAIGWVLADSRYQLFVNGKRVQWGPAPHDPRWPEADPLDLASYLQAGKNVIACQVLFYGFGEGTWPMGKPGFIFKADIDGKEIVSDKSWKSYLAKSWTPGQYKRSFLRTLQESFDANLFPYGWDTTDYVTDLNWLPAQESATSAAEPSICAGFAEYQWEIFGNADISNIRKRSIPMMRENEVKVNRLVESAWITWERPADEYFDVLTPDSYKSEWATLAREEAEGVWNVEAKEGKSVVLTFDFKEQSVGWPHFTIDAPKGTIVELLVHEAHKPGGPAIINSHYNSWSRFICKEGRNDFETFDFESLRWLQLHIRNNNRPVKISNVGMRRRQYDFPVNPKVSLSDAALQKLMNASINTLYNSAQETVVDGMARERQQYSGDGSHQLHPIYQCLGDSKLPLRFINTFSQGLTTDGYFLDCWPAFDRLARIAERQMQLTDWGPILDHGVGFCFENYSYYRYTGDLDGLKESYPRLLRFFKYLKEKKGENALLPVEDWGIPSVWIDHQAFLQQKHKTCSFNLYVAAMCLKALYPLCIAFNDEDKANEVNDFGNELLNSTVDMFWSDERRAFVDNLPWIDSEGGKPRFSDRALSMSVIFDLCPNNEVDEAIRLLSERPSEVGFSYPCNAVWPTWALIKGGRIDVVLTDLRTNWANMPSVLLNNTISEFYQTEPDSWSQWSHCAVAPLIALYQGVAGVTPVEPGYDVVRIRPQLGDLKNVNLEIQTPKGAIKFKSYGVKGKRRLSVKLPSDMTGILVLDAREKVKLKPYADCPFEGFRQYELEGGKEVSLKLENL